MFWIYIWYNMLCNVLTDSECCTTNYNVNTQYENYRGWQGHIPSILISLCCEHQLYDCDTEQEYSYNVMSNQWLALAESKTLFILVNNCVGNSILYKCHEHQLHWQLFSCSLLVLLLDIWVFPVRKWLPIGYYTQKYILLWTVKYFYCQI